MEIRCRFRDRFPFKRIKDTLDTLRRYERPKMKLAETRNESLGISSVRTMIRFHRKRPIIFKNLLQPCCNPARLSRATIQADSSSCSWIAATKRNRRGEEKGGEKARSSRNNINPTTRARVRYVDRHDARARVSTAGMHAGTFVCTCSN